MNAAAAIVLLGAAGLLIALAWADRTQLQGRSLSLLRVLFPSWRFFETVEPPPSLWCRVGIAHEELGEFRPLLPLSARGPLSFLLNPHGNLQLACYSLLEQLESELDLSSENLTQSPTEETQPSVTSELVDRWVRQMARELVPEGAQGRYQWMITRPEDDLTLFVSEVRSL